MMQLLFICQKAPYWFYLCFSFIFLWACVGDEVVIIISFYVDSHLSMKFLIMRGKKYLIVFLLHYTNFRATPEIEAYHKKLSQTPWDSRKELYL